LSLASDDGIGNRSLGATYNALGTYDDAIEPLQRAVRILPNDSDARIELEIALRGIGRIR
jgi:Flp pilus assembly protein TadD